MMDMLIGGKHISSEDLVDVVNPYNGDVIEKLIMLKVFFKKCLLLKFQINYSMFAIN